MTKKLLSDEQIEATKTSDYPVWGRGDVQAYVRIVSGIDVGISVILRHIESGLFEAIDDGSRHAKFCPSQVVAAWDSLRAKGAQHVNV